MYNYRDLMKRLRKLIQFYFVEHHKKYTVLIIVMSLGHSCIV